MVKLRHDEIVEQLERHGLRHRTVAMQVEGEYLPTDVDWNNKDVLHRNHVHSLIDDVLCVVEADLQAAISLQRIAGIRVPLVLTHYDSGPERQTHFVTLFAWTMVTEHRFEQVSPTRTLATTRYTVAGSRFWMLFFPLIRVLLRINYRKLMSEDTPVRERRGLLRRWGYTFTGDGAPRDIRSSLDAGVDNVLPPTDGDEPEPEPIALADVATDGWTFLGRSGHLGLKLRREGSHVVVYPRSCPHEGADLSDVEPSAGCLTCPWHGRQLGPVATLDLDGGDVVVGGPVHELAVGNGILTVRYLPDAGTRSTRR